MRVLPSIHIGLETLRSNPLRTILSVLGIIMGAASLIAVLSIGDGAERLAREVILHAGLQSIEISAVTSDVVDGQRIPRRDPLIFGPFDADNLAATVGASRAVVLTVHGVAMVGMPNATRQRAVAVAGMRASGEVLLPLRIAEGRGLTSAESRDKDRLAVVTHSLAAELSGKQPGAIVGRELRIGGEVYRVIGVLEGYPGERGFAAFVPFQGCEDVLERSTAPRVRTMRVDASNFEDIPGAKTDVEKWVRSHGWTGQATVEATGLRRLEQVSRGIGLFKLLMGAFTAISLIVGGIGIMNVLLSSVMERTREIGIRKATGARRRDIVAQFLAESVAIATAGSLLGLALGLMGAFAATALMRAQTQALIWAAVTWKSLAISVGATIGTGLIFGTYPALRAAGLSPVDAMRYE